MSAGAYVAGLAFFAVVWGGALGAAWIVNRRRLAHLRGAPAVLAYALLATLALLFVHLLPAALGILTRGTTAATAVLLLAVALMFTRPRLDVAAPAAEPDPAPPADPVLSRVLAGVAVAALLVGELTIVRRYFAQPAYGIDALNFHLPTVARWIQTGSIWQVGQFTPDLANGNYPNNGNVIFLAAFLPWRSDFLVRFAMLPYAALTGVAVYALARELRAPRTSAVVYAAVFLAVPTVCLDLLVATLPDVVMTATLATGMVFLLRHARTRAGSDLVIAGLGLGCAFGTKWFGVTSVVAILVIWAAAWLVARRPVKVIVRDGLSLTGLVLAAGGIWMLRNVIVSGSPVFPAPVAPLGITLFHGPPDPLRDLVGQPILKYLTDGHAWATYFVPAWKHSLGLPGGVLAAGVAFAGAYALARNRRHPALLAAIAFGVLTAVYFVTPYTAFTDGHNRPIFTYVNVRYEEPALLVAAALAACAAGFAGRARAVVEIAGVAAVIEGLHRGLGLGLGDLSKQAIAVTVLLGALIAVAMVPSLRARVPSPRIAALGVAALIVIGAAGYGYRFQHRFIDARYDNAGRVHAWIPAHADTSHRVGLTGYWDSRVVSPVYPMFGPRMRNHVAYVGPLDQGMLHAYRTKAAFLDALRRSRDDVLVVGRIKHALAYAPKASQLEAWARSAGWRLAEADGLLALYVAPTAAN